MASTSKTHFAADIAERPGSKAVGAARAVLATGGILAALGATSCCIIPFTLFMLGSHGLGALSAALRRDRTGMSRRRLRPRPPERRKRGELHAGLLLRHVVIGACRPSRPLDGRGDRRSRTRLPVRRAAHYRIDLKEI